MPRRSLHRAVVVAAGLGCVLCTVPELARAEGRRALLVGINNYHAKDAAAATPPGQVTVAKATPRKPEKGRGTWIDLDGAVNDMQAMRELLVARFGFRAQDILVLQDEAATRDGILSAFRKHILEASQPGDVAFFFYAGHGSQVVNSKTDEADGLDETLVPADSYKGTTDIRDKELAELYNAALDRKVVLTVIFDSCHSGSVARGLTRPDKPRSLPPDTRDVATPPVPGPAPEERGLLVLSAAQDYQTAGETTDDAGAQHGVFSSALMRVLQAVAPDESAERVFLRVKAMMQAEGRPQEPVIAGTAERRRGLLFGGTAAGASGKTTVAVLRADGGTVMLQGGSAVGLKEGCVLVRRERGKPARLRVSAVMGLNRSEAQVTEGDAASVRSGDLFEVERWVVGDAPLRVYVPPGLASAQIKAAVAAVAPLRTSAAVDWVEDPTAVTPSHVVSWSAGGWQLAIGGKTEPLGAALKADALQKKIAASGERPKLFVQLPPPSELSLKLGPGTANDAIAVSSSPGPAQYLLVGRAGAAGAEYAWVLPNLTQEEASKGEHALPPRTDWVAATDAAPEASRTAAVLEDQALRLSKIRSWLSLSAPADEGGFPYRLALKNLGSGEVKTAGTLAAGETYSLVLKAEPAAVKNGVEKRFVYVFTIDSFGNSTLIFPRAGAGNVENRLPYDKEGPPTPPAEIELPRARFKIGPPYGTDSYILLTSAQAIANPDVLQFQGVRTRGMAAPDTSPLGRLLHGVGGATRGVQPDTPADWSLDRLVFRSAASR